MLCCLFMAAVMGTFAQQMPNVPLDPNVKKGTLPNGLTYYIRHNEWPEKRVNFYIAQKVGSMQEDDDQRGLAFKSLSGDEVSHIDHVAEFANVLCRLYTLE